MTKSGNEYSEKWNCNSNRTDLHSQYLMRMVKWKAIIYSNLLCSQMTIYDCSPTHGYNNDNCIYHIAIAKFQLQ